MNNEQSPKARRTIARDVISAMVLTITITFAVISALQFKVTVNEETNQLKSEIENYTVHLANILATPVWNLNDVEQDRILSVYSQVDFVSAIYIFDDENSLIREIVNNGIEANYKIKKPILFEGRNIGRIEAHFSDSFIIKKQREILFNSLLIYVTLLLSTTLLMWILVKKLIVTPIHKLNDGIAVIASGDYNKRLPEANHNEIQSISENFNSMASELEHREKSLKEHNENLELLNEAILKIFSASQTLDLLKTFFKISNEIVKYEFGIFDASSDHNKNISGIFQRLPEVLGIKEGADLSSGFLSGLDRGKISMEYPHEYQFEFKSKDVNVGVISIFFKSKPSQTDLTLLESLISITNMALMRQSLIRKQAFVSAELHVAETIQKSTLPVNSKSYANADLAFYYKPADRIGGDWFNVIESLDKKRLYCLMGDVTGHGLPQGLLSTAISGAVMFLERLIHLNKHKFTPSPPELMSYLIDLIGSLAGDSEIGMTSVITMIDYESESVEVCNYGHTFPIVLRGEGINKTAIPLVSQVRNNFDIDSQKDNNRTLESITYPFLRGDYLLLYTDGLTEAQNSEGDNYSRKFIRNVKNSHSNLGSQSLCENIIDDLRRFQGEHMNRDDICLVVLGYGDSQFSKAAS